MPNGHQKTVARDYQFPFELRHLVYFREVARRLHFRQAAEALSVARYRRQPAEQRLDAFLSGYFPHPSPWERTVGG